MEVAFDFFDHDPPSGPLIEQLILTAEAVVRYRIVAFRRRFKMTELQYRLMMQVAAHAPVSLGQLSNLVNRDCAQVSRTVKCLVEGGLMTNRRERGGPTKSIELSADGAALYAEMQKVGEKFEAALAALISSADAALATDAIERVYEAACAVSNTGTGELDAVPADAPDLRMSKGAPVP